MKNTDDLLAAFSRMHLQYSAGRIDRAILRGWVLGLPAYEGPLGEAVEDAKRSFAVKRESSDGVRFEDLKLLKAVVDSIL